MAVSPGGDGLRLDGGVGYVFNYIAISLGMIRRYIQIPATLSSLVLILRRRVHKLIKVQGKENGSN